MLAAAALFSTGGAVIKGIQLTGSQRASLRSAIAAVALLCVLPAARRAWPSARVLLVACGYAGTLVSFVLANTYASAATAIFGQSVAPLYLLLLAPWLLAERVGVRDLWLIAALLAGLSLLALDDPAPTLTATDPGLGLACALASSLGWALTMLGLRWLARAGDTGARTASAQALVCGNAIACLATLPWAIPIPALSTRDLLLLAYLGVFQIGLAYALLTLGLARMRTIAASLLLLLEPALSPLWAWLAHGERPGPYTLAAGGTILLATGVHLCSQRAPSSASPQPPAPASTSDT